MAPHHMQILWVCLWQWLPTKAACDSATRVTHKPPAPLTDFTRHPLSTPWPHTITQDGPQCGLNSHKGLPRGDLPGWRSR